MSKRIDFSKPGGIPLTQDRLAFLQTSYSEILSQLQGLGVNGLAPTTVSGMTVSVTGTAVTVTDGWFVYGGEMIKFTGSTVVLATGEVAVVQISNVNSSLTYYDGSSNEVILDKIATLTHAPAVTDATHFPVASLVGWKLAEPFEVRSDFLTDVIHFRRNRTILYSTFSFGALHMHLDFTNAVAGVELVLLVPASGAIIGLIIDGGAIFVTPVPASIPNQKTSIRIKYLGANGSNNYCTWESWQY